MKKKPAMLLFIILVSFAFHSCLDYSLPKKIDLEVEGSIDLPVKIMTSNWGSTLAQSLKKMFSGNDENMKKVEVYNVNHGQDVQAFCVYVPIEISKSLNPEEYLGRISDYLAKGGKKLEFEEEITVPSFTKLVLADQDITIPPGGSDSIPLSGTPPIPLGEIGGFLHATIDEGNFIISIDGNVIPVENLTITYTIGIQQAQDDSLGTSYDGFGTPSTVTEADTLADQQINRNPINIDGTISIINNGVTPYTGNLKITMNIKKLSNVDWDITKISEKLQNPDPFDLTPAAEVLNWLEFDKCSVTPDDGTPDKGIGINMVFHEFIGNLKMKIECNKLSFDNEGKDLKIGNNAFGNKVPLEGETETAENAKRLQLADSEKVEKVKELEFVIELLSSNPVNKNVLQIPSLNLEQKPPPRIKGEANFFQNWKKANVNVEAALIKTQRQDDGAFKGQFPAQGQKEIDLSQLNDYLPGFEFNGIQAAAYLNGPNRAINDSPTLSEVILDQNLGLLIEAQYKKDKDDDAEPGKIEVMYSTGLKLGIKSFDIKEYLDDKESSYKIDGLPPEGKNEFRFEKVINAMPEELFFHYEIKIPEALTVTPDLFDSRNDKSAADNITATMILLIDLELKAGKGGGWIKYPGMFGENPKDLFGRETPEEDSMFTSLDVGYIGFAIDFADAFFTGGSLFIEQENDNKSKLLFPQGIPVDGRRIAVNITNEQFDKIKKDPFYPDFRLWFKEDGKIKIPRNIGVTSIRIEAKGKSLLKLDF